MLMELSSANNFDDVNDENYQRYSYMYNAIMFMKQQDAQSNTKLKYTKPKFEEFLHSVRKTLLVKAYARNK